MKIIFIAALAAVTGVRIVAQDSEAITLSPFVVAGVDRGGTDGPTPTVPVTLRKPATALVVGISLANAANKPEERNQSLYETIQRLEKAVNAAPGLHLEKREMQMRGDPRRKFSFSRSDAQASMASVTVVAALGADTNLFDLVRQIRTVVSSVNPVGDTKVADGPAELRLENPDQFRQEIMAKIFADFEFLKKGFGPGFEILPSGLTGPVQMRNLGERDVELWIDYGFTIRSVLQLQNPPGSR